LGVVYREDGRLVLSATDLVGYLYCDHLTELSLEVAAGLQPRPADDDPGLAVVQQRGIDHEHAYLARLRSDEVEVVDIPTRVPLVDQVALTERALADGPQVIYQAAFLQGDETGPMWRGHADFLSRVSMASRLGDYSYEPEDTKLARHVRPSAVLQLCEYADQLARLQGHPPEQIHVVLGGQTRVTLRLADFGAYFRAAKARFEAACEAGVSAYPDPVEHCATCSWREVCDAQRTEDDHLTLVAGLRSDQARFLEAAGIRSVAAVAGSTAVQVPGIGKATLEKLRRQALLQTRARAQPDQPPPYELLDVREAGLGLASLPEPSPGDLFFDIEGDPFVGDAGLEYLLGVGWLDDRGVFRFTSFWAHDPVEEKASFEAFIDFVMGRLRADPHLHIYHYAPYEPSALGRLMGRHATRENEVDSLLRGGVLVDLYRVTKQGVQVGTPSYSLKKLEGLYMPARTQAITDAGSSIVEYERWLADPDPHILQQIEEYNRVDCDSTRRLRHWLEDRRVEFASDFGAPLPRPPSEPSDAPAGVAEEIEANDVLRAELLRTAGTGPVDEPATAASHLLGQLLDWHRREDKPAWWEYFHRAFDCDTDDLYDDTEAIAGLEYAGISRPEGQSTVYTYRFDPRQEFKLKARDTVVDPAAVRDKANGVDRSTSPGSLVAIDAEVGTLELKRGVRSTAQHPGDLIPGGPIPTMEQRNALRRVASSVVEHGIDGAGPYRAIRDLLMRRPPRTCGPTTAGRLVGDGEEGDEAVVRIGGLLEDGYLAVQGPPGSGKTRAAAKLAVALVDAGQTVGITANSHSVITNLLDEIGQRAEAAGVTLTASQKADPDQVCSHQAVTCRETNDQMSADLAGGTRILAGTAWMFARGEFDQRLDYLIIDEAGQFSLANTVAAATAARNLVLVGDPLQLAQPSKGTHPEGVNASGLGHVLGGAGSLPDDLGVFLDVTYRLHPEICRFISEIVYEDRLRSAKGCERQSISGGGGLGGSGLRWRPVPHSGNRTSAVEEADEIARCVDSLLGRTFTDRKGADHPIGLADVLVVAPYNAQVRLLQEKLPAGAVVGTVDKFQGRQAPVVIVSMTTSSVEEIPRGMDFLYSRNRLNVAVSRAKALAVMVGSPELLTVRCRSVDQLRLVNGLCRYVELAQP
jgi:predicted RecB family nuclease